MRHKKQSSYILYIIAAALVVIAIALVVIAAGLFSGAGTYGGIMSGMMGGFDSGMMNGNSSMMQYMVGMMGQVGTPVAIQAAIQNMKATPAYAVVSSANDSISFQSKNVSLVVLAMGVQRAINLTHEQPPSFDSNSSGNAFVIDGLINPTLIMPEGAIVHVDFINLDSSEYHNIIMTSTGPPYQYMPMSAMAGLVSMMPFVQHADYQQGQAYQYLYNASFNSAGTFYYLCTYPGHAQMGMYGKIIVI